MLRGDDGKIGDDGLQKATQGVLMASGTATAVRSDEFWWQVGDDVQICEDGSSRI